MMWVWQLVLPNHLVNDYLYLKQMTDGHDKQGRAVLHDISKLSSQ